MLIYDLKRFTKEIKATNKKEIKTGCCYDDPDALSICKFNTKEKALEELSKEKYKPSISGLYGNAIRFYIVEEYAIEIYEVDEDGEFFQGSDYDSIYDFHYDEDLDDIVTIK